ncbi:hypothetical protein K488DRAFT_90544 [Vararia minispora EC-137]|uniref:Uncharacterized protein n=1 Tax=Vararia minispora EC-137 TaxID=1314806 RepID=A0ACB8Q862_9AGAM|nr:hypothetical protein K488DRAFT_90544 [Vararia minispora EC-137]
MRPLLSRAPSSNPSHARSPSPAPAVSQPSTIRLISATPSAAGSASDANNTFASTTASSSFVAISYNMSPLAPRAENEITHRKLVPKKSRLGLLSGGTKLSKERGKDMSDMFRRVTGDARASGSSRGGFEIYVDPTTDPDLGEIVMVKKKKSRGALNALGWGVTSTNVLSEVANTDPPATLKPRTEEKDKWWSIGRGRKDSKDGNKILKENVRQSKAPAPIRTEPLSQRNRFNSLDSGVALNSHLLEPPRTRSISGSQLLAVPDLVVDDQFSGPGSPDEVQTPTLLAVPNSAAGSIAVRAMRSMRSLAHMTSWTQLKPAEKEDQTAKKKEREKEALGPKKKKKKEKKEKKEDGRKATIRNYSGSSFEAGALTTPDIGMFPSEAFPQAKRKASMLGLGLPSTIRFGSTRTSSAASSLNLPNVAPVPLRASSKLSRSSSVNLSVAAPGDRRPSSTISTGSSLRPPSTISANSRTSSSSAASVKWDERGLETVKEQCRQEREGARPKETRRTSEGRRRAALIDIFPTSLPDSRPSSQTSESSVPMPIVTIEEATADGHSVADSASYGTPERQRRPRPISEQMLTKERPKGICMLSLLDAATNDLASLISRLDLEASPGTPNGSPLRLSPSLSKLFRDSPGLPGGKDYGSPIKKPHSSVGPSVGLRGSQTSVASLRPYAQSRGKATISDPKVQGASPRIGQQIAPWPISPTKPIVPPQHTAEVASVAPVFKPAHRRTLSPAPAEEPPAVFRPLRPASRKTSQTVQPGATEDAAFDCLTSPVFRRAGMNVPLPLRLDTKSSASSMASDSAARTPIAPEARRGLGTTGTLGGSTGSVDVDGLIDSEDPDSDIPDELQVILSAGETERLTERFEDTMSFNPSTNRLLPSPGSPPGMPLPMPESSDMALARVPDFHVIFVDEDDDHADTDGIESDEDGTKKSFDFTGELKLLNESADRRSFVEQLESAFRTPAKFDLQGFGEFSTDVEVPPLPPIPRSISSSAESFAPSSHTEMSSFLPRPEISIPRRERKPSSLYEVSFPPPAEASSSSGLSFPQTVKSTTSFSRSSTGELNVNFKFGGKSLIEPESKPLTLSDIIPPPEIQSRLSMVSMIEEDSSVLKSIMGNVREVPSPLLSEPMTRRRTMSDSSSKFFERNSWLSHRDSFSGSGHTRPSSQASFSGLESFDEIRRGFEFGPDRPAFYPPPAADSHRRHKIRESVFSIASESSYGVVLNPGVQDPFEYGRYDLPSRPSSDGFSLSMSMSNTIDDTFDFMQHRDSRRRRVDSDASSFYFHPLAQGPLAMRPLSMRAHRRNESNMSAMSVAPPVSLYNRSFGGHRRMDSNSSASSVAHAYAMGAQRMSWGPRHRHDLSVDSVLSNLSAMCIGRPGLSGDKMLESAHGVPLTAISASPPESLRSERFDCSSAEYDSIMDGTRAAFNGPPGSIEDSLFEQTGYRTSASSESLFGGNDSRPPPRAQFQLVSRYRPVSIYSINEDTRNSVRREDDTIVTMLDGNHVRRRSMDSMAGGSPCVRVGGKRKRVTIRGRPGHVARSDDDVEHMDSPNKARLVEKPSIALSIASTTSHAFGDDRMIRARHGLLKRESLEESCLEAAGEDLSCSFNFGPVFARPGPAGRSRSSTYSSVSSDVDTPPLSVCEGSQSSSSDSQSSIDIAGLNLALANMTHPVTARTRLRTQHRGHPGHRRDRSARQSVYETIQEEAVGQTSPAKDTPSCPLHPLANDGVVVVNSDTMSLDWDDDRNVLALRKYYALRDEAHVTIQDSKRVWIDTPFSIYAIQSFQPPAHIPGMRALLEYSQENYRPLPQELRSHRVRSRTSSRTSPYPAVRTVKRSISPSTHRPFQVSPPSARTTSPAVLQDCTQNVNTPHTAKKGQGQSKLGIKSPLGGEISPFVPGNMGKLSNGLPRPRVASNARRNALGWAKRSTGKENKENRTRGGGENVSFGIGIGTTPGELRFSRPRPRGRPTPASTRPKSIRV